jgi:6-phosphogluconate dehydrogenase
MRPGPRYIHVGSAGAGHFLKMAHNGIEYGLMQAYAGGLEILKARASKTLPERSRTCQVEILSVRLARQAPLASP